MQQQLNKKQKIMNKKGVNMAKSKPIKNRKKDRQIFARTAKKMNPKNLIVTDSRGGIRM